MGLWLWVQRIPFLKYSSGGKKTCTDKGKILLIVKEGKILAQSNYFKPIFFVGPCLMFLRECSGYTLEH